ncbi:MAG: hypothetical protein A2249_01520 [Candidatus Jacksonbacteria bacterium RIFOXYA2_FULL_44_7]|uniref:ROK family protein n=1 Tax=Candidatus Jacksonbacteria bacterium RIFCSPLOWO2_02_FULL_44_20 TaxID=1798460 RepID=A0A1G2A9C8_9BACT|nr:MAG: hypothetical protein UW39_C0022G0021 [Parcubacteria group bacterium GW2011_GWC2_44_17]KKT50441.1 MAG: hypothetical protein UW40_C0004G0031 [Parcubacteria group bacterium GW2011_GWF2_44_17]OGY71086.1 MAG: hypothetical protein A3C00_01855 [Candidatus Jacksonbacteria bacterium RIFCSPHIGHO2_02_FULL_44_25]OGY73513.1 MAG: hypothetical protein A3H61_03145 [Candidatus Jacksonbacteria bacterium RIFCSPLOWO2_02_FULL_44_20]OGY75666.1 MAG: hypothetical protein A2249_01520 [Candidatus Jacksonbacteria
MYFLFDIGGTKMRLAIANSSRIVKTRISATPLNFSKGIAIFEDMLGELKKRDEITAVCGGVPGILSERKNKLVQSPHLKQWVGRPLGLRLAELFDAPVYLENDSALAGLGEAVYGAGKGKDIVAYYAIGTGVGGARIVLKKIDFSAQGFEPGHQIIGFDKAHKHPAYLEDYVSGSGIAIRYQCAPSHITSREVWNDIARHLAYGLNNSILHWSPDIVVLGGGLMLESRLSLPAIQKHLQSAMRIFPKLPPIVKSSLGDLSGLYGALAFLKAI